MGLKNVRVSEHVYRTTSNTNSVIVSTSVHNQRMERLRRDITYKRSIACTMNFNNWKTKVCLMLTDDTDLLCLHLVYLIHINCCLHEFVQALNHHSLSTEGNQTPLQLFHANLRLLQLQFLHPSGLFDINELISHSRDDGQVTPVTNHFGQRTYERLARLVSRNRHTENFVLYQRQSLFISKILDEA